MLDSNDRRDAFDAFFASLDNVGRGVFLADADDQRHSLQEEGSYPVSLIDCMENVWDYWTELAYTAKRGGLNDLHTDNERAIAHHMNDPERIARERAFRLATANSR